MRLLNHPVRLHNIGNLPAIGWQVLDEGAVSRGFYKKKYLALDIDLVSFVKPLLHSFIT